MSETLKSPPLLEALCEFKFAASGEWDWTVPGRLYDQVKDRYPKKAEVQGIQLQVEFAPGGQASQHVASGPERIQLKTDTEEAMLQVGPNTLAVNHLRPYPGWSHFRTMVLDGYGEYTKLVPNAKLERVGVRYIDRIPLHADVPEFDKYIRIAPYRDIGLGNRLANFVQHLEFVSEDPQGVLLQRTGTTLVEGQQALMVDMDFGSTDVGGLTDCDAVGAWIDAAHDVITAAFIKALEPGFYEALKNGDYEV
jgi:uncharacterized protein (TIGR04255 family)